MKKILLVSLIFLSGAFSVSGQELATYKSVSGVSGNLSSVGSDTLNNLMSYWSEDFRKFYPGINFQVEGKGSSTAPPALIESVSQFGPMSRKMKTSEIDAFESKFGYKPTAIPVAIDALSVFVHKDNPLDSVSLEELDGIFSSTLKSGIGKDIKVWSALGVKGAIASKPISLYGRNSASGTYDFFKQVALFKGDFKKSVKEQPGSSSVVQSVGTDKNSIGYSGVGYLTSGVKSLAVSKKKGGKAYTPVKTEDVISGKYPLARFLYVYVNKAPGKPIDPKVKEFIKYVLSKQGQAITEKDGYIALPGSVVAKTLKEIE